MAAYLIADVEVKDAQAYEDYRQKVPAVIAAYGGRYLVRGRKQRARTCSRWTGCDDRGTQLPCPQASSTRHLRP